MTIPYTPENNLPVEPEVPNRETQEAMESVPEEQVYESADDLYREVFDQP